MRPIASLIVPSLPAHDPLLQHLALVLQAAVEGEGVAGQLYAESLADALVVHFLKRYAAARPSLQEVTGGLSPYKLRRTTAYIQAHLAQELSLATLAAVAQTSPAHFARLFKHATGLAPHQYVIRPGWRTPGGYWPRPTCHSSTSVSRSGVPTKVTSPRSFGRTSP